MEVHLVDGAYELFRHCYALPPARDQDGREVAADAVVRKFGVPPVLIPD